MCFWCLKVELDGWSSWREGCKIFHTRIKIWVALFVLSVGPNSLVCLCSELDLCLGFIEPFQPPVVFPMLSCCFSDVFLSAFSILLPCRVQQADSTGAP